MASTTRTIAVLFGTRGGMSDVGKFAATQAAKTSGVTLRAVAMYSGEGDGSSLEIDVDVAPKSLREEQQRDFKSISLTAVDVDDVAAAQAKLEEAIRGTEAVVACLASRQPSLPRWLAPGTGAVVRAMRKVGVQRLVHLSSFGLGESVLPMGPINILWSFLLNVCFRAVKKDLMAMEDVVANSGLDYLLVRPVGLTPEEPPTGKWAIVKRKGDAPLKLSIAKSDVAGFMLKEALEPTVSSTAVTIGSARS